MSLSRRTLALAVAGSVLTGTARSGTGSPLIGVLTVQGWTARTPISSSGDLGIAIPEALLLRADEVIG